MKSRTTLPQVFVVCGDPGGANALASVIEELRAECRVAVAALAYRHAGAIWAKRQIEFDELADTISYSEIVQLLRSPNPRLLVTGTSFNSINLERKFIAAAREIRLRSLAVLDFWSCYTQRFDDGDRCLRYLPDRIAVIDERNRDEMILEGFPSTLLVITGQPAFDDLMRYRAGFTMARRQEIRGVLGVKPGELLVLFASQPLSNLYGTDAGNPLYPGFSEWTVLPALTDALDQIAQQRGQPIVLMVRPHPREDLESFAQLKAQTIRVIVSRDYEPREMAMAADLTTGMNTVLLLEACYLGCVTASLQPGLRLGDSLPTNDWGLSKGIYQVEEVRPTLEAMLLDQDTRTTIESRLSDLELEDGATQRVVRLVYEMAGLDVEN